MNYVLHGVTIPENSMARPRYETVDDLTREQRVAVRVGEFLGRDFEKMDANSGGDFLYTAPGKPSVVVEIKTRTNACGKYPTYMVSKNKYDRLCSWHAKGYRATLFVHWTDMVGYVMVPCDGVTFGRGGRTRVVVVVGGGWGGRPPRDDALDTGTMAYIPTNNFKSIGPSIF